MCIRTSVRRVYLTTVSDDYAKPYNRDSIWMFTKHISKHKASFNWAVVVAQLTEQTLSITEVRSSYPVIGTIL